MLLSRDQTAAGTLRMQVLNIFEQVDHQTAKFRAETGIHCLPGCGRCCRSTKVEAGSLEMLPAAEELFRRGDVLDWLEKLAGADNGLCTFYQADPHNDGNGRCQIYSWRPLVCRLFGWVTSRNKYGEKKVSVCSHIKRIFAEQIEAAELSASGLPCYTDFSTRIFALNPSMGARLLPINQAFQQALSQVGLWLQLMEAQLANVQIRSAVVSSITLAGLQAMRNNPKSATGRQGN
jgi:Fe-S-cluster containining protein